LTIFKSIINRHDPNYGRWLKKKKVFSDDIPLLKIKKSRDRKSEETKKKRKKEEEINKLSLICSILPRDSIVISQNL